MMKWWHFLTRQIEVWRQKYQTFSSFFWGNKLTEVFIRQQVEPSLKRPMRRSKYKLRHFLAILLGAIVVLTSVVGYRFYNQPQLTVGKISPVTIQAPTSGRFEDFKTTLEKRREVQTGIIPILKQNQETTAEVQSRITNYLKQIDDLRQSVAPFPFYDRRILSLDSQQYIRSCSDLEFKTILASIDPKTEGNAAFKLPSAINFGNLPDFNLQLQKVTKELQKYRQQATKPEFDTLIAQIILTRYRYTTGWKKLQENKLDSPSAGDITVLLDLTEENWQTAKKTILLASDRILTQGIPLGMPSDLLEQAATVQLTPDLSPEIAHLAKNMLLEMLQPNLEEDKEATHSIAEKAARAIEPVVVEIEAGEVIVEQGERITQADFVLLDGFKLSRRSINWQGLELSALFVAGMIALFLGIQKRIYTSMRRRDYLLLCLLAVTAPVLSILNIPYTNLAAIAFLVSSFYIPGLAICTVFFVSALVLYSNPLLGWQYLLAGSAGGLLAATLAGKLRSREAMARLGVAVGLTQGMVYFIAYLILSGSPASIWSVILPGAIVYGLSGVVWSIVAIGISPYLERCFDLITPIRLAELSNPNLPLLKRLATEAPGTFQHTMFVASLAEAAARELNCNVELVRAGTLYHDIGKMHDPLGFIENQLEGVNKHDEINDPWKSVEIIRKHVSEGLIMARKYGLPKAIRDFIPEHQGTLLIAYFYHQAKQQAQARGITVSEADFRYVGPIPQSREAGIMMLADACEAALRSLKNATPKQVLVTTEKIFKSRWQDGQLLDSGLHYQELPIIAAVFVRVWQQFNHKRIVYPKGCLDLKPQ
jgi:cyclic-di-AMP phosphodiesterase PgpH